MSVICMKFNDFQILAPEDVRHVFDGCIQLKQKT